jgi:hypothetical protein
MRSTASPVPLEDHEMRNLVADDFVSQFHGEIEHEARNAHQAALGVAATERAFEALTYFEGEALGETRLVPNGSAAGNRSSAGFKELPLR